MKSLIEILETRRLFSTYYVAPTGNDSGAGSQSAPFATLQNAANKVKAGDTVIVEPGTYVGFCLSWNNPQAGTAGSPITFEADPSAAPGSVIIDSRNSHTAVAIDLEPGSNYVDLNGFTIGNDGTVTKEGIKATGNNDSITNDTVVGVGGFGIFTDNANNSLIEYDNISGTTGTNTLGHGIYISGTCSGAVIEFNTIDGNGYHGIHLNGDVSEGGVGEVSNALIANNLIYNNPGNGINADGVVNSVFENNLIYGYTMNGISLYTIDAGVGSSGNLIVNNTIVGSRAIELQDNATGNVLFNNIFTGSISVDSTSGDSTSNNVMSSNTSALFVNASGGNYQLAANSPAIGEGVASFGGYNAPSTDLLGDARAGRYDAGAYEFGGTPNMPGFIAGPGAQYTVSGPAGAQTLAVTAGTITLNSDLSASLGNYTLMIENASKVVINSDQTVGALQISGTGALDLTMHQMLIDYGSGADPVNTIAAEVKSGFNEGTWTGQGITSSSAASDAASDGAPYYGNLAVGYGDNLSLGRTDLPTDSVLVRVTYYGDADLNGSVDTSDFQSWLSGYQDPKDFPANWVDGDFLYSGSVTVADFQSWLTSYQDHMGSLPLLSLAANSSANVLQGAPTVQSVFSESTIKTDASLLDDTAAAA